MSYIKTNAKNICLEVLIFIGENTMIDSKNCTGCGACENICPRNAIKMVYSNRGFYVPQIDEELCNNCGKCSRVCPQIDFELKNLKRPKAFAISASDEERLKSSSGGFFPTLAKYILNKNGYVVGVAWNKDWEAQHIIIDNIDDLDKLRFSKYVQAKTGDVYKKIRDLLNNNNIVLFSGTPCQNAGLLKYLNKDYDNLLTVDVLCHGVPSPKIWQEYLSQNFNKSEITGVNFRAKDNGWKYDSDAKCDTTYIEINHKRQEMKEFNYAFLKNILLNEPCLECKYRKTPRTGDFTCGDFWKYWKYDKKLCDGKGLSIVLCNNKKAEKYMNLIYKEFKIYKKINIRKPKHVELELPSKRTAKREIFFNNYKKGLSTSKLLDAVSNVHYDVGLLSQFNGLNYGSALVAYAAYEIITSMGYSVLMINKRWVGKRSNEPSPAHKNFIFANKHFDITKLYEYIDDNTELNSFVDTFITGSDTLWWDTSKAKDFFFLDFALSDKRKVAFSTSFAFDEPAINENKQKALKYLFKRFDSISVREQSGVDILKNNFGIDNAVQIYDPTLIADRKIFDKLAEESDLDEANYILAYILDSTKEKIKCINEYAKILNKKLIIINNPYLNFKYDYRHKPSKHKNYYLEDFVYLIKNADFIITDSFHGACFSTIYEKKFVAILNKSRGGARYKIFDDMALSHRIIKSIDKIFNIQYTDDVNFTTAKRIIMREREKGLNWLKEALTKPKRKCTDTDYFYDYLMLKTQAKQKNKKIYV